MSSKDHFKGKRIALVGLGAHGEMVEDAKYLIKAGAWVSIYDLKSEARLKSELLFLRSVGLANYVCGSIPSEDLLDMDIIILSHEYPRNSSFLRGIDAHNQYADENNKKKIAIEYPETLFFKLAPPVTLVGVIGPCGKSTVISILGPMLEHVCEEYGGQSLFVIDPESSEGALAHLKKAKSGDIVLMRMPDVILGELHAMRISPHVAIFTGVPGKQAYKESPFEILSYQTYNNFLVASDELVDVARSGSAQPRAKMLRTKPSIIPAEWGFVGRGPHDRVNAALALQAGKLFKLDDDAAHKILGSWKALRGRLELVKKVKMIEFYNDTASTAPDAVLAGLSALSKGHDVVLIIGGADLGHDYRTLYAEIPKYAHTVIILPGSGSIRERRLIQSIEGSTVKVAPTLDEAVLLATESAQKGDKVLFSPGFGAVGVDGSKKERGEKFVRAVRGL
ncbi:MAG: hypothetical protein KBC33_03285 [Candidatus Pacebacteria bacterium]|nr:hypothetical protein [Candidatus Paceibacterota bacterium]